MIDLTTGEKERATTTEIVYAVHDDEARIGTLASLEKAGAFDPQDVRDLDEVTSCIGTIQRTTTACGRYHITVVSIPIRFDSDVRCSDTQAIYCALHRLAGMLPRAEEDHAGIRKDRKGS